MTIGPVALPLGQLDGTRYASVNCGPTSAAMAIAHASSNRVTTTPEEMRSRGAMGTGATGFTELKRGIAAYDVDFARAGLQAPNLSRLGYIDLTELVPTLVDPHAFHIIAVKYAPIHHTPYDGCPTFDGAHFITAQRIYVPRSGGGFHRLRAYELARATSSGAIKAGWTADKLLTTGWTLVEDPLADGRRPSIPQAPQLWPISSLFACADAFNDAAPLDGQFTAAVIYRAEAS